jgi:nitrogen fixation NifU-like protein
MSSDMYKEIILDYYRNPRNKGKLEDADVTEKDSNPLCGDVVQIQLKFRDNKVKDVKFEGEGCAISQASASMLTEIVMGKEIEEVSKLSKEDVLEALGRPNLGPVRIKCALLPLKVMKMGVYSFLGQNGKQPDD